MIIHEDFDSFVPEPYDATQINVYIININLNVHINGLQIAQRIRSIDYHGYIIFVTSHIEMTALTYHYNLKALNFIYKADPQLKSLLFSSLDQILVESACPNLTLPAAQSPQLTYSYNSHHYKIPFDDIQYIETHGLKRCLVIHTSDRTYEHPGSIMQMLPSLLKTFVQCYRSIIINISYVKEIGFTNDYYEAILSNNTACNISKKYLPDVVQLLKTSGNKEKI